MRGARRWGTVRGAGGAGGSRQHHGPEAKGGAAAGGGRGGGTCMKPPREAGPTTASMGAAAAGIRWGPDGRRGQGGRGVGYAGRLAYAAGVGRGCHPNPPFPSPALPPLSHLGEARHGGGREQGELLQPAHLRRRRARGG